MGWGEAAPGKNEKAETVEQMQEQLTTFLEVGIESKNTEELHQSAKKMGIAPCAFAALAIALWDHLIRLLVTDETAIKGEAVE